MRVTGVVRPPGDKSISHRVLMLAALARGKSELRGLLTGADVKSSAGVLRQLGAEISPIRETLVSVSHALRTTHHARFFLEVDGGISRQTIAAAHQAGADTFVAGNAVFGTADPGREVQELRRRCMVTV